MKMNKLWRIRGHLLVAVVVAIAALGLGVLIGFLLGTRGPPAQEIADGLSSPVPIPVNATLLKLFGPDAENGVWLKNGKGYVLWRAGIALDVTGMTPAQVEAIPNLYESYLENVLPDLRERAQWLSDHAVATRGFTRFVKGQAPPEGWTIAAGGNWTWNMQNHAITKYLLVEVNAEVMDFAHLGDSALWEHIGVLNLNAPAKGQRVMYIKITVDGEGLRDSRKVTWSPEPRG